MGMESYFVKKLIRKIILKKYNLKNNWFQTLMSASISQNSHLESNSLADMSVYFRSEK